MADEVRSLAQRNAQATRYFREDRRRQAQRGQEQARLAASCKAW
ncbi:MAG: hypothetical protein U1F83_00585 [Verrucomicrobiota bacterium]